MSTHRQSSDAERAEGASPKIPFGDLVQQLYHDLRGVAAAAMANARGHRTLRPTELVHEAFLLLQRRTSLEITSRAHLLGIAAHAMRQILVDHARARAAIKRGGNRKQVALTSISAPEGLPPIDLLALDGALDELKAVDERASKTVELRFFGGLTIGECAEVLAVSHTTVENDWAVARAFLRRTLSRGAHRDE